MSNPWAAIATRGCLDAEIWTEARLRAMGIEVVHPYLVLLLPDGDESDHPQPMWCTSLDALVRWCQEMRPRVLYAHTAGEPFDIHCDDLIAQCRHGAARH